jgi:hypothetical protein
VKCDEGKPFCARCIKFGADCDGYEDPNLVVQKNTRIPQPSVRIILPRIPNAPPPSEPPLTQSPFTSIFRDNKEYMYFLHFQEDTARALSGPFDAKLWSCVALQACINEPVLVLLTTSIAALDKATRLGDSSQHTTEADAHQQYALLQYGRALRGVQRIIKAPSRRSARIVLIAALLIFCIESMHGDLDSAIMHMESAIQLMHKQISRLAHRYRHLHDTSPTPDLEYDLVAAFVRVDNALMSRPDKYNFNGKRNILGIDYSQDTQEIPHRFKDTSEARRYLENIQFQALPSIAHEFGAQVNKSPESVDESTPNLYQTFSSQIRQWHTAFAPLFAESFGTTNPDKDFVAKAILLVQALSAEMGSQRVCNRGNLSSSSDFLNCVSRKIIDLSKRVVADPSFRKTFVFDYGVIPGLFVVVVTGSDRGLRMEALQVLRNMVPRREGAWDSKTLVKVGEYLLSNSPSHFTINYINITC